MRLHQAPDVGGRWESKQCSGMPSGPWCSWPALQWRRSALQCPETTLRWMASGSVGAALQLFGHQRQCKPRGLPGLVAEAPELAPDTGLVGLCQGPTGNGGGRSANVQGCHDKSTNS